MLFDLKVSQKKEDGSETVFQEMKDFDVLMSDTEAINPVTKRILQSMKKGENVSTQVRPDFVEKTDPEFKTRHPDYNPDLPLTVDIHLKGLCAILDLYKDKTVFYKTLKRGQGTASPYYDCHVTLRVKIDIDGENKIDQFEVGQVEEAQVEIIAGESSPYDLEEYTVPACVRKLLKITKPYEVV